MMSCATQQTKRLICLWSENLPRLHLEYGGQTAIESLRYVINFIREPFHHSDGQYFVYKEKQTLSINTKLSIIY